MILQHVKILELKGIHKDCHHCRIHSDSSDCLMGKENLLSDMLDDDSMQNI